MDNKEYLDQLTERAQALEARLFPSHKEAQVLRELTNALQDLRAQRDYYKDVTERYKGALERIRTLAVEMSGGTP